MLRKNNPKSDIQPLIDFYLEGKSSSFPKRSHLFFDVFGLQLYTRTTRRHILGEMLPTLDLAAFEIEEEKREQGLFRSFLEQVEAFAKEQSVCLFVESILQESLAQYFESRGYIYVNEEKSNMVLFPN